MNSLTSNSLIMMEKSMDYLWTKQTAILDNIANAETPGYKTKYVTFEETLQKQLDDAVHNKYPRTDIRDTLANVGATINQASNESTRFDGNGVNITEQNVELARTAYQLQYAMNTISSDLKILRTAIQG